MKRLAVVFCAVCVLCVASAVFAGGLTLSTASGMVSKVGADSVTIRPRGPDGRFGKNLTLAVTGTSKVSVVTEEKRGSKLVFVQRDISPKDLEEKQNVTVIYATAGKGAVLLSAVAVPTK
jgi:hypothetical protein